jgi:hypothetical protein
VRVKIKDCLDVFARARGHAFPMLQTVRAIPEAQEWLPS